MSVELLNKLSDKKLARLTTQEIDEALRLLPEALDIIESLPDAEDKISALNERFGFLKNSLLHLAAKFADVTSTQRILEIAEGDRQIINARNEGLFTPLHFIAHSGDPVVAQLLLEAGAENNPQASLENRHWTPIHYAAKFGHDSVVETLINSGVNKETATAFGLTPLLVAAEFGQQRVLDLMLKIGANKNAKTIKENHCMNALHYAATGNFIEMAVDLLKAGIERNYKTNSGLDALDFAIQCNHPEMAALLLTWGIGNIDEAFKHASELKSANCKTRLKDYVEAKKNFFNSDWLTRFSSEIVATLKQCNRQNLGEIEVKLPHNVSFTAYGILALKRRTGFFRKRDEKFLHFCKHHGPSDLTNVLNHLEQIAPKN